MADSPPYAGVQGEGLRAPTATALSASHTSFLVWVIIIGVVLPVLVLGGLRFAGFQFVFRSR